LHARGRAHTHAQKKERKKERKGAPNNNTFKAWKSSDNQCKIKLILGTVGQGFFCNTIKLNVINSLSTEYAVLTSSTLHNALGL
jgi:hypothetical protein